MLLPNFFYSEFIKKSSIFVYSINNPVGNYTAKPPLDNNPVGNCTAKPPLDNNPVGNYTAKSPLDNNPVGNCTAKEL